MNLKKYRSQENIKKRQQIYQMKKTQLIQNPLILPHQIPLFDYNVNFMGLKKLLQDFNINLNSQKEEIDYLKNMLSQKADKENIERDFSLINGALDLSKASMQKLNPKELPGVKKDKKTINQIVEKLGWVTAGLDRALNDTGVTDKNLKDLDLKIEDKLKRLQNQLESKNDNLDKTITKNIESYFKDVSGSTAKLEASIKDAESRIAGKLADAFTLLERKINMETLDAKIGGIETKLLGKITSILDDDGMKRVKLTNDLIMNMQNTENNLKDKYEIMEKALADLMGRTNNSQTKADFEKERNKIYQNMNESKSRLDDIQRKTEEFFDFKRHLIIDGEKGKVEITNILLAIEKLKEKMNSTAGLSNVQGLLEKLDPHKICEIDNMCRLHNDQIGKIEKKLMELLDRNQKGNSNKVETDPIEKVQSLNVQEIVKLIKDYMLNLDVEERIKKNETDIKGFNNSIDLIKDMDRKIQIFTKEFDYGFIIKQLQKRCLQQNTRRQSKITNGRIDQLHEFLKMIRKDLESLVEYVRTMEIKTGAPEENALLSSKKLYPLNCLSCQPGQKRRHTRDARNRDMSIDVGRSMTAEEDARRKMLASFQVAKK